jgi:hypothetical protein
MHYLGSAKGHCANILDKARFTTTTRFANKFQTPLFVRPTILATSLACEGDNLAARTPDR